jgi:DNA-directed RNA polymerase subunit RPC12/RpoP
MKIVEIKCKKCKAEYETLESIPKENIVCPACGNKKLEWNLTDREFSGCGGGCKNCSDCK